MLDLAPGERAFRAQGLRDEVFLIGQVMAEHATREGTHAAFRRSLERLDTDRLDLYLLGGPRRHALEDTLAAFEEPAGPVPLERL